MWLTDCSPNFTPLNLLDTVNTAPTLENVCNFVNIRKSTQ